MIQSFFEPEQDEAGLPVFPSTKPSLPPSLPPPPKTHRLAQAFQIRRQRSQGTGIPCPLRNDRRPPSPSSSSLSSPLITPPAPACLFPHFDEGGGTAG